MNREHLRAFLWLRWRLMRNQWRRGGPVNAVLMTIVAVSLLVMALPLFAISFAVGLFVFPKTTPVHLLYAWDGMVAGFVSFWIIGLLTDLQRTETLSLSKFLHLPVSVNGAFLINYVSSLLRLGLILFVPVMFGCGLALIFAKGVLLLSVLPLTAAFFLMVTALTYQFQGWLASLMSNPRRRRTIVVAMTGLFVLICQLPQLLNVSGFWGAHHGVGHAKAFLQEIKDLDRASQAGEFDQRELMRHKQEATEKYQRATEEANREFAAQLQQSATIVNMVLPIGWLPLGVMSAADGNVLPAILGFLGMTLIGSGSLWRAYRTTVELYQGQGTSRQAAQKSTTVAAGAKVRKPGAGLVEAHLPWFSEPVSAIALGGLRSLLRAPESKMMLLTPVLLSVVFGSMVLKVSNNSADSIRALMGVGAIGLTLLGMLQLMANQFGFDRDGFRVFVLCAVRRRDILLGKNLAFAPLALGLATILVSIVQVVRPLRVDHLLSMLPQFVSMFLLFCMLTNLLSICTPMHFAAGTLKPTTPKVLPVLAQIAMFTFLLPLAELPTLLPLGIEALLVSQGWADRAPICLALTVAQSVAVIFLYRWSLNGEGKLLQAREQKILETVTNRAA